MCWDIYKEYVNQINRELEMIDEDNSNVGDLLNSKDKGVTKASGILSILFRQILVELNVNWMKWNLLMNKYLDDPKNRVPKSSKGRSSTRGNLSKELIKPQMTWGNFEKAIRFLNPLEAEFTIRLKWRAHKYTHHTFKIIGSNVAGEEATPYGDADTGYANLLVDIEDAKESLKELMATKKKMEATLNK